MKAESLAQKEGIHGRCRFSMIDGSERRTHSIEVLQHGHDDACDPDVRVGQAHHHAVVLGDGLCQREGARAGRWSDRRRAGERPLAVPVGRMEGDDGAKSVDKTIEGGNRTMRRFRIWAAVSMG